jgi:hypothetical protein
MILGGDYCGCPAMHGILALPGVYPDFLWRLNAPMSFMRLSSRKRAYTTLSRAARQEMRDLCRLFYPSNVGLAQEVTPSERKL